MRKTKEGKSRLRVATVRRVGRTEAMNLQEAVVDGRKAFAEPAETRRKYYI